MEWFLRKVMAVARHNQHDEVMERMTLGSSRPSSASSFLAARSAWWRLINQKSWRVA